MGGGPWAGPSLLVSCSLGGGEAEERACRPQPAVRTGTQHSRSSSGKSRRAGLPRCMVPAAPSLPRRKLPSCSNRHPLRAEAALAQAVPRCRPCSRQRRAGRMGGSMAAGEEGPRVRKARELTTAKAQPAQHGGHVGGRSTWQHVL